MWKVSATFALAAIFAPAVLIKAQGIPPQPSRAMHSGKIEELKNDLRTLHPAEAEPEAGKIYTLADLIDFAQAHNPETRVAWERAKQGAAKLGISRSKLYPALAAVALLQQSRNRILFGDFYYRQDLGFVQPALSFYYMLLDFGARRAGVEASSASLLAADLAFNNTHRQLIYSVSAAYYRLTSAQAQIEAAQATLTNAQTVQTAVEERLKNGLATLPDVLEARASTAQAAYELETARGAERLAHGQLTETLGVRPTMTLNVQHLDAVPPPPELTESVDALIDRALAQRPDLLAQVAQIRATDAAIRSARSAYFPTVSVSATGGDVLLRGTQIHLPTVSTQGDTWLAQLNAKWTIFDGRERYNELDRARSERRQSEAELNGMQHRIANEVWAAFSNIQTSLHRQVAAEALFVAADQSYSAALEAYRYGVKDFLDVISAQRTLALARTARVQSRAEVLTNFSQLAFETGDTVAPGARPGR